MGYDQKKRLKEHFWYKSLPAQSAQEVLKQLHESWKLFYKLKRTGVVNSNPPKYKHNNHLLHMATKTVIDLAMSEGVSRIILGDLSHIRDGIDWAE